MRKRVRSFLIIPLVLVLIMGIPFANSQSVPDWVKNTAGWWAHDAISETEFVNAIQFLVNEGIIKVQSQQSTGQSQGVADWVKNTAGWWARDAISETEFVNAIQFLVNEGIISIKNSISSEQKVQKLFDESIYIIPETESYAEINSHGFRGKEIIKEKPDNVFRIFAVGGSTTFSVWVEDEFSWPFLLEKKINELNPILEIQVINAGIPAATSFQNSKLIKQKLVQFEPDLIIIYEGVNDQGCSMPAYHNKNTLTTLEIIMQNCGVYSLQDYPIHLAERYSEVCDLGKRNNFEVIIVFQPTVKLDGKILTNQELDSYFDRPQYPIFLEDYNVMIQETLDGIVGCEKIVDLTKAFDSHDIPIYFDYHHVGNDGNTIVADNMSDLVIPLLIDKEIVDMDKKNIFKISNKKFFDLRNLENVDFSNKIIKNESFFALDLRNSNFSNSELDGIDLRLSNLEGANFKNSKLNDVIFRQNIFKNADLTNVDLTNVDLTNVDLSYTNMENVDLSGKDLRKTFLHKSNLKGANLSNTTLNNSFLYDVDLTNVDLTSALLNGVDFQMIKNADLSSANISGTGLSHSNFVGVELPNKMVNVVASNAEFSGSNFSERDILGSYFGHSNFKDSNFENVRLGASTEYTIIENGFGLDPLEIKNKITSVPIVQILEITPQGNNVLVDFLYYNNFINANLENSNMQNGDYYYIDFTDADLKNANLENSNLISAYFVNANLKNANLEGANLEGANLEGANLEGANLEGANLKCINHEICD